MEQESPAKKQLRRDMQREALRRTEDAARTVEDFENVIKQWNRVDENRLDREEYHESIRSEPLLQWGASPGNAVIPAPYGVAFWRQMMIGNFIDVIYACPYEMHELVEDRDIAAVLRDLKDNHRELLWYNAVRLYNVERLSKLQGCTERNIRKTRKLMLKRLRDKLAPHLQKRVQSGDLSVTWNIRAFLERHEEQQKAAVDKGGGE